MMTYTERLRNDLVLELIEMKKIGMRVSDQTIEKSKTVDLSEYDGISIADLASLFCELYNH